MIENGQLDSETKVKVLRVDFEPVDEELIEKLGTHLTMPVDTALNIITDSDDTLEIDIPVKGDLANPDIRINTIIVGAVSQAVQNAAMTYFKYAVQPFVLTAVNPVQADALSRMQKPEYHQGLINAAPFHWPFYRLKGLYENPFSF